MKFPSTRGKKKKEKEKETQKQERDSKSEISLSLRLDTQQFTVIVDKVSPNPFHFVALLTTCNSAGNSGVASVVLNVEGYLSLRNLKHFVR